MGKLLYIFKMKFSTIVLLFVSATAALKIREEPAAAEGPAPADAAKNEAAIEKAAKGEENAKEAKDEEWQNPYGKHGAFGEYEGKIGGKSKLVNGTKDALDAKVAAKIVGPEPEAKAGEKIDGDVKEEEKGADTPAKEAAPAEAKAEAKA